MGELLRAPEVREPPLLVRVGVGACRARMASGCASAPSSDGSATCSRPTPWPAEEIDFVERDALSGAEREKGPGSRRAAVWAPTSRKDDDEGTRRRSPVGKGDKGPHPPTSASSRSATPLDEHRRSRGQPPSERAVGAAWPKPRAPPRQRRLALAFRRASCNLGGAHSSSTGSATRERQSRPASWRPTGAAAPSSRAARTSAADPASLAEDVSTIS